MGCQQSPNPAETYEQYSLDLPDYAFDLVLCQYNCWDLQANA
jgi:hypothetical protein